MNLRNNSRLLITTYILFSYVVNFFNVTNVYSQEAAEGVGTTIDKKRRSPVIVLGTERTAGNVKILVDAYVPNSEYAEYPIKFDFLVNGESYTSQVRSKEFNRPIGIDIPSTKQAAPFNYTIIATLLHPNRQFVSMAQGAVYGKNLSGKLSCTATILDGSTPVATATPTTIQDTDETEGEDSTGSTDTEDETTASGKTYTLDEVSINQTGAEEIGFSFTGTADDSSGDTKEFSGTFTVTNNSSLSGTISQNLTNTDGSSASGEINLSADDASGAIGISVSSSNIKIECGDMTEQVATDSLSLKSSESLASLSEDGSSLDNSQLNNTYYEVPTSDSTNTGATAAQKAKYGENFVPLSATDNQEQSNADNLDKLFK